MLFLTRKGKLALTNSKRKADQATSLSPQANPSNENVSNRLHFACEVLATIQAHVVAALLVAKLTSWSITKPRANNQRLPNKIQNTRKDFAVIQKHSTTVKYCLSGIFWSNSRLKKASNQGSQRIRSRFAGMRRVFMSTGLVKFQIVLNFAFLCLGVLRLRDFVLLAQPSNAC